MTKKNSSELGVGVIGYGYWGPNLVRNFMGDTGTRVVSVCDRSTDRLTEVKRLYPSVEATTDPKDLFKNADIDAIAIATPVATHFDLAREALRAGKHVLVEKPAARNAAELAPVAAEARRAFDRAGVVVKVGFNHRFHPAVVRARELIATRRYGRRP